MNRLYLLTHFILRLISCIIISIIWHSFQHCSLFPHLYSTPAHPSYQNTRLKDRPNQKIQENQEVNSHPKVRTQETTKKQDRGFIRRQIEQLLGTKASAHESGFLLFPTLAYAPETRWDFGINALYVYFANDRIENRLSEINTFTFYTQEHQYGVWVDHTLYSDHNEWFFYGKARFQYFPMNYYGIGLETSPEVKAVIDSDLIWFRERILKKMKGSLYLGLELDFRSTQNLVYRSKEDTLQKPSELPFGIEGGTQVGLGLGLIYDNCHNAMNVRDGILAEIGFLHYHDALSQYPMDLLFFDGRTFFPTTDTQVLALQVQGNFSFGRVPFNQLPMLGGANMMRGYYTGRYRDRRSWAAQVEYRFLPFVKGSRIGGALFGALGTVSPDWTINRLLWAVGFGPRVLLFPQKDIFTRFDFALTEEGTGVYFYIGEAF